MIFSFFPPLSHQVTEAESLTALEEEFGIPNRLESDMAFLGETASWADCRLVFAAPSSGETLKLLCHKSVLAARSGFFRRLLEKRGQNGTEEVDTIHLDNDIIPRKYGRVLLHAMYMDALDMRLVEYDNLNAGAGQERMPAFEDGSCTKEGHALSRGRGGHVADPSDDVIIRDVMNLYEIGRFLEFNFLSQASHAHKAQ